MTEQEQRIALCDWMGWKQIVFAGLCAYVQNDDHTMHPTLPNTNSLDVLHEMEMKLDTIQYDTFETFLEDISVEGTNKPSDWRPYSATAAHRREALLKTLGLWKDS